MNTWIGTGWKMNHTISQSANYIDTLLKHSDKLSAAGKKVFIIPPFTSLETISQKVKNTEILVGAQNMHWKDKGAYTGEISPVMLAELGIDIVEIGHSERRLFFGETDNTINLKVISALKHNICPLICFGEDQDIKSSGAAKDFVGVQVKRAIRGLSKKDIVKVLFAYEPIWAIGKSGNPATPDYAIDVIKHVRSILLSLYGEIADKVPILYGGSVNLDNSNEFLSGNNIINGLFVGRAAWDAKSFINLIENVNI